MSLSQRFSKRHMSSSVTGLSLPMRPVILDRWLIGRNPKSTEYGIVNTFGTVIYSMNEVNEMSWDLVCISD